MGSPALILGASDSMKGFYSLALAFSPSQSLLDHSGWFGKGWGTLYLQNMHVAPSCSHTFWGMGFMMFMLPTFITFVPSISTQLVLIGLKQWLQLGHHVLTLPGACFLGVLEGLFGWSLKVSKSMLFVLYSLP